MSARVEQLQRETKRSWLIVAGVLVLAVLIDVMRELDGGRRKQRRGTR